MNATRVLNCAGRKLGITSIAVLLLALPARSAQIIVTVTGTVLGGGDSAGIFKLGKEWAGAPFTLVFTFDDTKGYRTSADRTNCPKTAYGIEGKGESSPGTAVITINGISHEFGKKPTAHSMASRSISSLCSESVILFEIDEGPNQYIKDAVNLYLRPASGVSSLTQDPNWSAALSTTSMKEWANPSGFAIVPDFSHYAASKFMVKTLTITRK